MLRIPHNFTPIVTFHARKTLRSAINFHQHFQRRRKFLRILQMSPDGRAIGVAGSCLACDGINASLLPG